MSIDSYWLNYNNGLTSLIGSAAYVTDGVSAGTALSAFLGESNGPAIAWGVLIDVTVQGGTQASVDIDLEAGYNGFYTRVARYNSVPADGVVTQMLVPGTGAKPLPIGAAGSLIPPPATLRIRRTFNTPGGTPTITFTVYGIGWMLRNNKLGFPGLR